MIALERLQGIHFLQDLPQGHLQELASVSELRTYPEHSVLFREGQVFTTIHLIVEGRVGVEIRVPGQSTCTILTVGAGELLGWSPLLGAGRMTATARALSPVQVVVANASQVLAICRHNTAFGFELMSRVAQALSRRLEGTRLQLLDVYRQELRFVPEGVSP
jgi:CRP-like cAMP-binding protein